MANQERVKVMLNKALYIPLIMALLGLQAGLQTARGQDSRAQASPDEGSYTWEYISQGGTKIQGDAGTEMKHPQACIPVPGTITAATNYGGDAFISNTGCRIFDPVCSATQSDYPHRVTSSLEQNGTVHHVVSWTPSATKAGPIWFSCHAIVCC